MKEPEKWCIKVTPENKKAIEKWRTANALLNGKGYCVNKTSFNSMIGYWQADKPSGYTEISFEEFKVYTSKPKDLTGRYVKCLVDGAQGTKCKAGEIYKLVSLDNTVETQVYKLEDGLRLCISPTTDKWELLPEDYSADKPLKQAVHCETQEEWDFACDKYDRITGVKTLFGKEYNTFSYTSSFRGWNTKEYYIKENYQILSFQEWCDLNGYKMEKSKQEILKEFAEKYPPGTKVKSPDGIEFIISTTYKYEGENNYFLQGSPYYISSCGDILAIKGNTCVGEYLCKDGKYAEIIKDTPKFEVGKWYRITNGTCKAIGKNIWYAKSPKLIDGIIICEEHIHKKINKGGNFGKLGKYTFTEVSIEEIQQYLPDNHPDKIKSNQGFEVGKWYKVVYRNVGKEYYLKYINNKYEFGYSEYISVSRGEHSLYNSGSDLNAMSTLIEASLEEIQQYLPDDHPDKIKSNPEFKVGDFVVSLDKSISYEINEFCIVSKTSKTHLACENKPQEISNQKAFKYFRHATPEEIHRHLVFTGQTQQYLPDGHPDKIKSTQEFKVGDYIVLQYSSAKEIGYNTTSNNTRLKAGHIDKIANFRDGQTWSENSKIRWVGLESDPHNGVIEILLRHATQEEINNHLISIGQIPAEKYPFKKLEEDDLTWEIRWIEPISMTNENWKPKMILSTDDEELPMVNIIKTNTVKQLLTV